MLRRVLEREIVKTLIVELRPPSGHQVVGRIGAVPAHQGVHDCNPVLVLLHERPVAGLVTRNERFIDHGRDGIVRRVDGQVGAVIERQKHPQMP